jgi:hypothetical protein
MFENMVLKRVVGPKMEEGGGDGEEWVIRSFINCYFHQFIIEM